MKSSFLDKDVTLLLKDITGMVEPLNTEEREKRIQTGMHYCEMLPIEYEPSEEYMKMYKYALNENSKITAYAISKVSNKILDIKGKNVVLVSLARAGIPIGILIKRYLKNIYNINIPHYAISIIRDRGIDKNALHYILKHHRGKDIQFIDGWTGKGAILNELKKELKIYKNMDISDEIAVLSDPANITSIYGTHEDFLIPSSCLNSTISGLISRTFLDNKIIGSNDFHGAMYYGNLKDKDLTYEFIDKIEAEFSCKFNFNSIDETKSDISGIDEVKKIANDFKIKNINFVKPGIGETTRVLLRRVPWKIIVNDSNDKKHVNHILKLAEEKSVEVIQYPLKNYKACGLIKDLNADI